MIKIDTFVIRFYYPYKNSPNKKKREKKVTGCVMEVCASEIASRKLCWEKVKEVYVALHTPKPNPCKVTDPMLTIAESSTCLDVYSKDAGRREALKKLLREVNMGTEFDARVWDAYLEMTRSKKNNV